MVFAFTTMGEMKLHELVELRDGKVCPLLVYEYQDETIVPIFSTAQVCFQFCRRNLPDDWVRGFVKLTPKDIEKLAHFSAKVFNWPRKIKDVVKFNVHIHEFEDTPLLSRW